MSPFHEGSPADAALSGNDGYTTPLLVFSSTIAAELSTQFDAVVPFQSFQRLFSFRLEMSLSFSVIQALGAGVARPGAYLTGSPRRGGGDVASYVSKQLILKCNGSSFPNRRRRQVS